MKRGVDLLPMSRMAVSLFFILLFHWMLKWGVSIWPHLIGMIAKRHVSIDWGNISIVFDNDPIVLVLVLVY